MSVLRRRILASMQEEVVPPSGYTFPLMDGYTTVCFFLYDLKSDPTNDKLVFLWQSNQEDLSTRYYTTDKEYPSSSAGKLIVIRGDLVGANAGYLATDDVIGWYHSTDGGKTWETINAGYVYLYANIKATSNSNTLYTLVDYQYGR